MNIAVDVMGGDYAPAELIAGAIQRLQDTDATFLLVGDETTIKNELEAYRFDPERIKIIHASQVIHMDESPATALRKKKDASIVVATRLVKEGAAHAVISCGSTGAQMAAAIFILGRMDKIDRPPIVTAIPTEQDDYALLIDVGANVDCKPRQMLQFAVLGSAYAATLWDKSSPVVALLNNGEEETKGNSLAVESYGLLKQNTNINFVGNIEGRDIFSGKSDVIVCDGFTGNILLKCMEGMGSFLAKACGKELGYIPAVFQRLDYSKIGGAPLLGVEGISIVCHGSSKREAVYNGIRVAEECVQKNIVSLQKEALSLSQLTE
ncbi:MAG: phosphate acyltransferase PlsX [Bacillota bacterium]|nr:phosphate acyltransferase PlsX [Bacillota bacterium]